MNTQPSAHWDDRLSEYLDGDLTAAEREACDAHLAGCADCSRLLEDLKAVVAEAGALPAPPPPAELWAGIEARMETPVLQMRPRAALRERLDRRWSLSGLQLGGAAAALVAVTAGAMWLASPRGMPAPGTASTGRAVAVAPDATSGTPGSRPGEDSSLIAQNSGSSEPSATPGSSSAALGVALRPRDAGSAPGVAARTGTSLAAFDPDRAAPTSAADFGIGRYDTAIAAMEDELNARRSQLNPETVRVVEANLAVVDKAIAEARSALAADPASRYLNTHLANTMRRKVDLLRRVNSLTRV